MSVETDRELLELAAKAYWGTEIDDVCSVRWLEEEQAVGYTHADNQDHNGCDVELVWNPTTDDGDALRLAVKLRLHVSVFADAIGIGMPSRGYEESKWVGDPYAATRRAIVLAAAAIGGAMP